MKFRTQEEFGLRCLISIAREGEGGFLTIQQISEREGLSVSHVAKLLALLRRKGLLESVRGKSGGYRMARPATRVLITDVLEILGGRLYDSAFCGRHAGLGITCVHDTDCLLRPLWGQVQVAVDQALAGITLQHLMDGSLAGSNVVFSPQVPSGVGGRG